MKVFTYKGLSKKGEKVSGDIDADTRDGAIEILHQRDVIITSLVDKAEGGAGLNKSISFFSKVPVKEVVFMARQIATLFEAHVSANKAFSLIAEQAENQILKTQLRSVTNDLASGISISQSLSQYPETFSSFFVNMVKSGEETGKLSETFIFLADYMERQYELNRKIKSALIYPAFVIAVFLGVMVLMFTFILPKLGKMITESGQPIPVYTQIILKISDLFVNYGLFVLIFFIICITTFIIFLKKPSGKIWLDNLKIKVPAIKTLFHKLYLARIADNLDTMLSAGIPIIRTLEVTSAVVSNRVYENIIKDVSEQVKSGVSLANAFAKHTEIPSMLSQMIRVGEETGMLGQVLKTLGKFYSREVDQAVDTIVSLIEPAMIVLLGVGVGTLLVSVLVPIYNISMSSS